MPDITAGEYATGLTILGIISFVLSTELGRKAIRFVIMNFHYVIALFFSLMAIVSIG